MAEPSPYRVSMCELDAVHVRPEDMVEERDVTPPTPDIKGEADRERDQLLRISGPGA